LLSVSASLPSNGCACYNTIILLSSHYHHSLIILHFPSSQQKILHSLFLSDFSYHHILIYTYSSLIQEEEMVCRH
jgi:hypothetical protein